MSEDKGVTFEQMVTMLELYASKSMSDNDVRVIATTVAKEVVTVINKSYVKHTVCNKRNKVLTRLAYTGIVLGVVALLVAGDAKGFDIVDSIYGFALSKAV